ncbi:DUF4350 domain-containing protein [Flavobacterium sp. GCM10023249]|uniref:DUF4350 domain-containing protein n=1 Tax=unclassified Flavobacterium TaxID=196869 RepID=UPI0036145938
MNNKIILYIVILLLVIIGVGYIDAARPKPINWNPSYKVSDKIPLGLYVFDKEIGGLLKDSKIEKLDVTPYEFFTQNYANSEDYENDSIAPVYTKEGTFLYIDESARLDDESINEILTFVSYGNKAFISAKDFPRSLQDSLQLNLTSEYSFGMDIYNSVYNDKLGKKEYKLNEGVSNSYFNKIDYETTTALGYIRQDTSRINFVKINYYQGEIYLHNQPAAFTNFHLLKDNHHEYAEKVLSYVPKGNIFWYTKEQMGNKDSESPLRYILSQPALKWAWYIFLIGTLLFMIFNVKRKQRIVPIIKPLHNTTIDFVKTIGNLYHQEGDHDNIIEKKIIYFLERVRNEYLMDTTVLDDHFIRKLHQKSGKDISVIEKAVRLINAHKKSPHSAIESDLIEISTAIENVLHKD